jgi:hypothetical protein
MIFGPFVNKKLEQEKVHMNVSASFQIIRPLFIAVIAATLIIAPLSAQQDKQSKTGNTSTKDSNIKSESDQNSTSAPAGSATSPRAMRAHGKSTQGSCEVRIHNLTYLKIKVFVNGEYLALVAPYGNVTITGDAGTQLEIYERADFVGGKEYKFWPTSTYACDAGQQVDENLN